MNVPTPCEVRRLRDLGTDRRLRTSVDPARRSRRPRAAAPERDDVIVSELELFCPVCECAGIERTSLGYIANDGTTGRVAGVACRACGYIAEEPGAVYVPEGSVDLHGMTALDWMLTGLRAAGCDPRPRP